MSGYNTLITALCAAAAAIVGWIFGFVPGDQAFMAVWALLLVVFARIGVDLKVGGWFAGYKTIGTAISGMIVSIGTYFAGELSLEKLVLALVMGFLAIFFRRGIKKAIPGTPGN